jgi:hypothetical protein
VVSLATLGYLKWSEVPITFDRSDHSDFVPKLRRYPLIVCPIVKDVKLNRVFVDGGSSLNILFLKTFNQMGLSRSGSFPWHSPSCSSDPRWPDRSSRDLRDSREFPHRDHIV